MQSKIRMKCIDFLATLAIMITGFLIHHYLEDHNITPFEVYILLFVSQTA